MIREFWAELNTPSDFYDDPYGALLNAFGHAGLGAIVSGFFYAIYGIVFEEMPQKEIVLLGALLIYGGVIEWYYQRSPLIDGLLDTLFVMLGVVIPTASFTEIMQVGGKSYLQLEEYGALASITALMLCIVAYVAPRARRKYHA